MKKILTGLAVMLAVSTLHAASINWSITGSPAMVVKDYLNNPYVSTAYLILAEDLSGITSATQDKTTFEANLAGLTLATASSSDGKMPSVVGQVVTSDKMDTVLTKFGLLIVSEDEIGNGYFKVVTVNKTPYADGAGTSAQTVLPTSWSHNAQQWTQGYVASSPVTPDVPEPATGMLALAGVAMLFRRKRA